MQANLNQNDIIFSHSLFDTVTHYNRNEDCEWLIEANYNQKVKIEFTFFALEADSNCNYDQTIVYDGSDDTATQLARLCGTDVSITNFGCHHHETHSARGQSVKLLFAIIHKVLAKLASTMTDTNTIFHFFPFLLVLVLVLDLILTYNL